MHVINITVRNKIAVNPAQDRYVCGNSDFVIRFDFDAEWETFDTKTARFVKEDGSYVDQIFSGSECPVPVISDTYKLQVGVYAGDLSTTTAAYVPCKKSILCGGGVPADPAPDVYNQIMARLNAFAPEATEPHTQLVTDADGNMLWEEKLAYKHVTEGVMLAEVTLPAIDDEPGAYFITTPWEHAPAVGDVCTVAFNGVAYECTGVDASEMMNVPAGSMVGFGNFSTMNNIEDGNADAPFQLISCANFPDAVAQGMYGMMFVDGYTDAVTVSVTGEVVEIKKLDKDFLPNATPLVLTIDEDGNITSDTAFADAWEMSAAQLRAAIVIRWVENTAFSRECTVDNIIKTTITTNDGQTSYGFQMRVVNTYMDTITMHEPVRYLIWLSTGALAFEDNFTFKGLPHFNSGNRTEYAGTYLRYNSTTNGWEAATIEQLKADLGLT